MNLIQTRLSHSQEVNSTPSTNTQTKTSQRRLEKKHQVQELAKHIILERDYIRRLAVIVLKSAIKTLRLCVKLGIWEGLWLNLVNRPQCRVHEQNLTLPSNPAAWCSENFCIFREVGGKAISLLFWFQSFFLHAVMYFQSLSYSICFSSFLLSLRLFGKGLIFLWATSH